MADVSIIGIDLAKSSFQVHGAAADGAVAYRKKLSRPKLLGFLERQPPCTVAMESCSGAHEWARRIGALGHEVRLIAPSYVKPYVKRQKNDQADAEAIVEACSRKTMRFVAVKGRDQQAAAMRHKTRDLLKRQRTALINALRGQMAEFGIVVPQGVHNVERLRQRLIDPASGLPEVAVDCGLTLIEEIDSKTERLDRLDRQIRQAVKADDTGRRLMTIPGVGPILAGALTALSAPPETFRRGRDFAAWCGLTPKQHSTGGKPKLGHMSKAGQRELRRLLIIGAASVVGHARRKGTDNVWLARQLERKPPMLVTVALANKMARIAWALMAHGGVYEAPAAAS